MSNRNLYEEKHVFFAFHGLFDIETAALFSAIKNEVNCGNAVSIYYCGGGFHCTANPLSIKKICKQCKEKNKIAIREVNEDCDQGVTVNELIFKSDENKGGVDSPFPDSNDLRDVFYKGEDSGYATLSTYIGLSRNHEPLPGNYVSRWLLKKLHSTFSSVYESSRKIIQNERPTKVHVFNGRLNDNRAVIRASQKEGVDFVSHEYVGPSNKLIEFSNALPHSLKENLKIIEYLYIENKNQARDIADEVFAKKKLGKVVNDKAFTAHQSLGKLPDSWDDRKRNITIFSSSEDEFKAIGKEWEGNIFSSQLEGVMEICESMININDKVYLRVHPNISGAHKFYKKKIKELKHPNLEVIDYDSKVSSYAMLDNSDLVITFGSSIGIEAAYWGKPSIQLGKSFYSSLGSTYEPENKEELKCLLSKSGLVPLPDIGALKIAVFWSCKGYQDENFYPLKEKLSSYFDGDGFFPYINKVEYIFFKLFQKILFRHLL